jgi:hypothetical protein
MDNVRQRKGVEDRDEGPLDEDGIIYCNIETNFFKNKKKSFIT